jgi:hypothetical protein
LLIPKGVNMNVPVNVLFQFGKALPDEVNINEVITSELKDRIAKLITGRYRVEADGRCILDPVGNMGNFGAGGEEPRDSVCVSANIGPISIGYCRDL